MGNKIFQQVGDCRCIIIVLKPRKKLDNQKLYVAYSCQYCSDNKCIHTIFLWDVQNAVTLIDLLIRSEKSSLNNL